VAKKSGLNRLQLKQLSNSIEIIIFSCLIINFITCIWILVGIYTPGSWIYVEGLQKDLGPFAENKKSYYIYALQFLLTILMTVGYGNDYSATNREYIFIMFIEFGAVIVQACFVFTMAKIFGAFDHSFKQQVREKLDKIDLWILKI
jgi:hypothetical protein